PRDERGMPGFGAPRNTTRSPAYAPVAGTSSAILSVRAGDVAVGSARWSDVLAGPVTVDDRVRLEVVSSGRNWIRTTVSDENGEPLAGRIAFRSPGGVPSQPHAHHHHLYSG